jgi:hypothetical protein
MHEELHQFTWNDVWSLIPRPHDHNIIGTKWIFKNKSDEYCSGVYTDRGHGLLWLV